jgi:hypothetical protein
MTVCIETTKNVSVQYSEKFVKEINKFFEWVKSNGYTIRDMEYNITKEWNIELLKKFVEPGRNKIESYLKELVNIYVILHDGEEVEDGGTQSWAKMIAKDYKLEKKNKKQEKKQKIENKKNGIVLEKKNEDKNKIKVSCDFETEDIVYLDTLKVKWDMLKEKFGEPIKTERYENEESSNDCNYRCEWKIKIGDNYYSIYDWVNKKGKFDSIEKCKWYISGKEYNENDINILTKYLKKKSKISKKSKKINELSDSTESTESSESIESTESSESIESKGTTYTENELFGDDHDSQTVEIGDVEIEDIDINLDDLKFE